MSLTRPSRRLSKKTSKKQRVEVGGEETVLCTLLKIFLALKINPKSEAHLTCCIRLVCNAEECSNLSYLHKKRFKYERCEVFNITEVFLQERVGVKIWPTSQGTEGRIFLPSYKPRRARRTASRRDPAPASAGKNAGDSTTWTATAPWTRRRARKSFASVKGTVWLLVSNLINLSVLFTRRWTLSAFACLLGCSSEEEFVVTDNDTEAESEADSNNSDFGSNGSGRHRKSSRSRLLTCRRSSRKRRRPRGYSDDEEDETDDDDEDEIGISVLRYTLFTYSLKPEIKRWLQVKRCKL